MPFSDAQINQMKFVFKRIDPTTIDSLQVYKIENQDRTGCTQVIRNRWGKPICVFQVFEPLSKYRKSLLMRLSESIPFQINIHDSREDRITVGWKCE